MSRSHRLCSPSSTTFRPHSERDLMGLLVHPRADRLLIGRSWSTPGLAGRGAYVTVPVFGPRCGAGLVPLGHSRGHFPTTPLFRRARFGRPGICRRAYRRCMRQLVAAGRYDELDAFPHRRWIIGGKPSSRRSVSPSGDLSPLSLISAFEARVAKV